MSTLMYAIYLVENCPWCWFWSFRGADYSKFGEWAWVGRNYGGI